MRAEDPAFRNYTLDDVLADVILEWRMDANFKRKTKPKSRDMQCADSVSDFADRCARIVRIKGNDIMETYVKTDLQAPHVHIARFPGMDIEFRFKDDNYVSRAYIGKRMFVYRDGKPCANLPDIAQVKAALAEDANNLKTAISFV